MVLPVLPVVFGRPDFEKELRAIGKAHRDFDVHTYVCGNMTIVKSLREICAKLTTEQSEAASKSIGPTAGQGGQKYCMHFERFG